MKLIACIDDRRGMTFFRRRQSRDVRVIEDVIRDLGGSTLFVSPYSSKLFADLAVKLEVAADPIAAAAEQADAVVFLEDTPTPRSLSEIKTVVLYLWGKTYPADKYFDADLSSYRLKSRVQFVGNSHDQITKETYVK